jgi:hypothetical protein
VGIRDLESRRDMTPDTSKLEKLRQQKERIENRIKLIQNKESAQKRKLETRRKILLGVMFHQLVVDGRITDQTFNKCLDRIDERDRHIFDGYLKEFSTYKPSN